MAHKKVVLSKLIETLEADSDIMSAYYYITRNEFIMIDHGARRWVDDQLDINDAPEWMVEQIKHAKAIEAGYNRDYYPLPDKYEINEYGMMTRFAHRINHVENSREVMHVLESRGAHRQFRKIITEYGLLDQWYGFKNQCYREVAIHWCDQYGFAYTE